MVKSNENNKIDVKIISLKRWNFPQTKSLYSTDPNLQIKHGDFVSFKSHHFIDIIDVDAENESPFLMAYNEIKKLRTERNKNGNHEEVYTVQNIAILGEKNNFWEEKADIMYVTFIQLANIDQAYSSTCKEIKKRISDSFKDKDITSSFALYHSLDFSDLVLFTKNISYDDLVKITWDLSLIRSSNFNLIRDTFTMFSFRYEYLMDSFKKIENGENLNWFDNLSLSADISIPYLGTLENFTKYLQQEEFTFKIEKILGRYDVRITTNKLSGEKVLKFLYALDKYGAKGQDVSFGGYEIVFLTENETIIPKANKAPSNRFLNNISTESIIQQNINEIEKMSSSNYIYETLHSIIALQKNGFADEFLISILLSFVGFIKIVGNESESNVEIMASEYFNAINTLSLCTMHSERQFIQSPAFNVNFFDVPPRLLAFYTAISNEIVTLLNGTKDKTDYYFIIVPDFREDIHIKIIGNKEFSQSEACLGIIHLSEKYFYDPINAIALLTHEIAHYVGNRNRRSRAEHIFKTALFSLFSENGLIDKDTPYENIKNEDSLVCLLINETSQYMMNNFSEIFPEENGETKFYLRDIERYFEIIGYCTSLFTAGINQEKIKVLWRNCLKKNYDNLNEQELEFILSNNYELFFKYQTLASEQQKKDFLIEMIITNIMNHFEYKIAIVNGNQHYINNSIDSIKNYISVFREVFADFQIFNILNNFDFDSYEFLLDSISLKNDYLAGLRHDALLSVMDIKNRKKVINFEKYGLGEIQYEYVKQELVAYLSSHTNCIEEKDRKAIENVIKILYKKDTLALFNTIHKTNREYSNFLQTKCISQTDTIS